MSYRRTFLASLSCIAAVGLGACRETTACDAADAPALTISAYDGGLSNPIHHVTIIYDRHGDDSLTVLRDLPTAENVQLGHGPGIYDFRLMAPGYADYLWTNVTIPAHCDGSASTSQVFMQKLP